MKRVLRSTTIIPIPVNLGQPNLGLDLAPTKLIEHGLVPLLGELGWRVKQVPQIISASNNRLQTNIIELNAKNCYEVGKTCETIYESVQKYIENEDFPLILGGDHCISIGTIPAIARNKESLGVVWVDAHADINTPEHSGSGNMHGMPLGFLLGLVANYQSLPGFQWFQPCLKADDIVYIGLRDLDRAEKQTIKKLGIKAFTMSDIDRFGIGKVVEMTLDKLKNKSDIHLSFDIDSLDPFFAPHTGTAVTGGLTYREGNFICEDLHASGKLSSMEIVEVDPTQHRSVDPSRTIEVALTLVGSAMGKKIL